MYYILTCNRRAHIIKYVLVYNGLYRRMYLYMQPPDVQSEYSSCTMPVYILYFLYISITFQINICMYISMRFFPFYCIHPPPPFFSPGDLNWKVFKNRHYLKFSWGLRSAFCKKIRSSRDEWSFEVFIIFFIFFFPWKVCWELHVKKNRKKFTFARVCSKQILVWKGKRKKKHGVDERVKID